MSIYKQCSEAVAQLRREPPKDQNGVFTELDVFAMISDPNLDPKDETDMKVIKQTMRIINNHCGDLYRKRQLCRYGPVVLADGVDYARAGSKLVYADMHDGPDTWITPNGAFPKLDPVQDDIRHVGRYNRHTRNDLKPWDEQNISAPRETESARIARLERTLTEREAKIKELEEMVENVEAVAAHAAEKAVEGLAERLSVVEEQADATMARDDARRKIQGAGEQA